MDRPGIQDSTEIITEAHDLLKTRGIKLFVVVIPDKSRIYKKNLPQDVKISPEVERRYATIMQALEKAGLSALDADIIMKNLLNHGKDAFYRTDQHWTQDAAEAVADASATLILESTPDLPGQPGSGMRLGKTVKVRQYGDLARLYLSPDELKAIGLEIYTARQIDSRADLLDDTPAPVHIVGHSMMQSHFGFPQKLSNAIDRQVSLSWQSGENGPWKVFLDYLESETFRRHKPKIIVWQMFEPTFSYGPNAKGWWQNSSLMTRSQWITGVKAALSQP